MSIVAKPELDSKHAVLNHLAKTISPPGLISLEMVVFQWPKSLLSKFSNLRNSQKEYDGRSSDSLELYFCATFAVT